MRTEEEEEEEIARLVQHVTEKRREQISFAHERKTRVPCTVRGVAFDREMGRHLPWIALQAMASRVADELLDLGFPALFGKTEIRIEDYDGDCGFDVDGSMYTNTYDDCPSYTLYVSFYVKRRFHEPETEAVIAEMREKRRRFTAVDPSNKEMMRESAIVSGDVLRT